MSAQAGRSDPGRSSMKRSRPEVVTCTEEHEIPGGRVRFLGAVDSVTPAMTLLEMDGVTILVDCGADPGASDEPVELPDEAYEVDTVLLTHGHLDHVGGMPALLASGFNSPVFATAPTLAVARIVLGDGIRLKGGGHRDVRAFLGGFDHTAKKVGYGEPFKPVPSRDIEVTFHEAGHILGSASVEVTSPGARVIFSGDLGRPGSPILRDFNTRWSDARPVDLVVMESTYGDRVHERDPASVPDKLLQIIERARTDGGHILVPAFAIGRTQELIYHLDSLVESGRLKGLPVAVDTPMGLRVTDTYEAYSRLFDEESLEKLSHNDDPLDFKGLYAVRKGRDSVRLRDVDGTMMIIAGSGMCTGGRIIGHLEELLPYSETDVVFVGYQAPGTLGRQIVDAAAKRGDGPSEMVDIRGQKVPMRARVHVLHGLSAHADREELATWLDAVPGVRKVALHHGDADAQNGFAKYYK